MMKTSRKAVAATVLAVAVMHGAHAQTNDPGGSELVSGAVFGRLAGTRAARHALGSSP